MRDIGSADCLKRSYTYRGLRDPEEFEKIYDKLSSKIYRYAFIRLSSAEDAEDVLANTFLRLWDYLRKKDDAGYGHEIVGNIAALIYRIARNLIIDQYRGRGRVISLELLAENGFEFPAGHADRPILSVEREIILQAMEKLPSDESDLIILRFIEDMAVKEIAEIYGITENNASVRIHRVVQKLRKMFAQSDG